MLHCVCSTHSFIYSLYSCSTRFQSLPVWAEESGQRASVVLRARTESCGRLLNISIRILNVVFFFLWIFTERLQKGVRATLSGYWCSVATGQTPGCGIIALSRPLHWPWTVTVCWAVGLLSHHYLFSELHLRRGACSLCSVPGTGFYSSDNILVFMFVFSSLLLQVFQ